MLPAAPAWPTWRECPWALPEGVEARKSGDRVALCRAGLAVAVVLPMFDAKALPELLATLMAS